nr:AraC family transcriptional regulator [uncultured Duganella sp.]
MTNISYPSPRAEYTRRMNRVLNYIDQHLDQPLDLRQLAEVANFSPYHFHRVFAAWMGETLGDYARRRRLEKAAFRLSCKPAVSVLETALATGFGSGEAFSRAFKLKFGCTPTEWRLAHAQLAAGKRPAMRRPAVLRNVQAGHRDQSSKWPDGVRHLHPGAAAVTAETPAGKCAAPHVCRPSPGIRRNLCAQAEIALL